MKVNQTIIDTLRFEKQNNTDAVTKKTLTAPSAQNTESVKVSVSALASQSSEAPFNAQKVEQIKQAIREGKFSINAETIADKLLLLEKDLRGA